MENDKAPKRLPPPSCGRTGCMFHQFPDHVANVMMQRLYAKIVATNWTVAEWRETWELSDGMG